MLLCESSISALSSWLGSITKLAGRNLLTNPSLQVGISASHRALGNSPVFLSLCMIL